MRPARPAATERVLRRAVAVQEEERARIARELHDHLGQQVTALRLLLASHLEQCPAAAEGALDLALALARDIDAELDYLVWQLRPAPLDSLGLADALRQLVERWAACSGVRAVCRCDVLREQPLPGDAELAVYRVAQEALHNVQKHACASRVDVAVEIEGAWLVVVVRDDGAGFDSRESTVSPCGAGLLGMQERAALAGAVLEVTSAPGRGTTIVLRCPVPDPCAAAS